jgi:hypothetical protein
MKNNEIVGHVTLDGEMRNAYTILNRKPEENRIPGKPRHKGKIIFKKRLKEIGSEVMTGVFWLGIGSSGGLL